MEIKDLIWWTIGTISGFVVSFYFSWIIRKVFKIKPKWRTIYYSPLDNSFDADYLPNQTPYFRLVIKNDKLTDTITFRFTHYYVKKGELKTIALNRAFTFHYYDMNDKEGKFYIDLYKENDLSSFIDDICFRPSTELNITTNLAALTEVLNIKK
jgi:hypothetical protein